MNIYFDTEFTGLVPNTTLISIGLVTENDEKFYAEFTDYNKDLVTPWIKENVIDNLAFKKQDEFFAKKSEIFKLSGRDYRAMISKYVESWAYNMIYKREHPNDRYYFGNTFEIHHLLENWFNTVSGEKQIQLISDVCHYDMYLLCNQIFGGAFNLPKNVTPVCYDICQDLCLLYDDVLFPDSQYMPGAFNLTREIVCKSFNNGKLPGGKKHNALYDAEVIKMIYEGMRK